jgi:hypothetical protein
LTASLKFVFFLSTAGTTRHQILKTFACQLKKNLEHDRSFEVVHSVHFCTVQASEQASHNAGTKQNLKLFFTEMPVM